MAKLLTPLTAVFVAAPVSGTFAWANALPMRCQIN
jgi:hypothetical protein